MFLEGKKYACDACVRGHRVSGCNHNDRPLVEIAKKGRPVSQCQHCRALRKSRSSHIKCDCGDRMRGSPKHHFLNENGVLLEIEDPRNDCACPRGGRCNCSIKKEPFEPSPKILHTFQSVSNNVHKPLLQSFQSEGSLTKFSNGQHRPLHRHHHQSHGAAPYQIPPYNLEQSRSPLLTVSDTQWPTIYGDNSATTMHPPLVFHEMSHNLKSNLDMKDTHAGGLVSCSDFSQQPNLTRSISDYSLPASQRGLIPLSLQTDLSQFPSSDHNSSVQNDQYFSAQGSDTGSQISYFTPTTAWALETLDTTEPMFEIMPPLTQSVSCDDSELAYHSLPSPVHAMPFLQGTLSTDSSEYYESDETFGQSSHSSSAALSQLGHSLGHSHLRNASNMDLASMKHSCLGQSPILNNFNDCADSESKQYEETYISSTRNSMFLQDSEVLMMTPLEPQNERFYESISRHV